MVSDQLSSQNNTGSGGLLSTEILDSIVNLVELSNSELTLASSGESLPVTGLLLDALLDLLADRRPDLLAHSQRIGYLCAGIAGELNWTRKWTNNLICAGLLHELGALTLPSPADYCNSVGTSAERLARRVAIDFLQATHGDSDLLDILSLSHNFRYRTHLDEETPRYVLQGAVALSATRFLETCRVLPENPRQAPELLGALRTIYASSPDEIEVINALESWLSKETDENFDVSIFLPSTMSNDPETAEIVRETFQEILDAFRVLHTKFDSFFMLDGTGRFQIWSSKSEQFLGRSVRTMRNTHWSNEIVKYCNEEGFPFSDAQTPLYQTLTTGKRARLHLCMQDSNERLFEVEVNAVPIIGRDQLMQAILEFHSRLKAIEEPEPEILQTATSVAGLASELLGQFEQDPEQHPLPAVSFDKIDAFETRLLSAAEDLSEVEAEPQPEPGYSDSSIFGDEEPATNLSAHESAIEQSDVLIHSGQENQPDVAQDSAELDAEERADQERVTSDDSASSDQGSEDLDDVLSRFDGIMADVNDSEEQESDLSVTDSTIILKSPFGEEASEVFADHEFLDETPPDTSDSAQVQEIEEDPASDDTSAEAEPYLEAELSDLADSEISEIESTEEPVSMEEAAAAAVPEEERADEQPVIELDRPEPAGEFEATEITPAEKEAESVPAGEPRPEEARLGETSGSAPLELPETEQEEPAAEADTAASESAVTEDHESVEDVAEEISESESLDDQSSEATSETVEPELIEPPPTDESAEEPSLADSDFEITAASSEEPAPTPVEPEEPVEDKQPVSPTPLTVPELLTEEREEQIPAVADASRDEVGHHEWEEYVKAVMDESSPLHESIGVLLLEIDDVKAVSKEFGQQIVEDLMTESTRRLSELCSSRELSCRFGAEQFTIACPGLDLKAAYKRGDEIRQSFPKIRFDVLPIKKLTASVGVTVAEPGETFDSLIQRSEFALARAAKLGSNCCVALDSEEVRKAKQEERDSEESRIIVNEFELTAEFEAMIASDMIVYKLGGFLYDLGAKLIKVDRRHVEMRVGAKRLLPYWGKSSDAQPVLVDLQLGENWDQVKSSKRAVSNTTLQVRIRPDGWIKDRAVFKHRAEQVLRALKGYFAAK